MLGALLLALSLTACGSGRSSGARVGAPTTITDTAAVSPIATGCASAALRALEQVAYLFGRNYYHRSQVTGLGIDPPLHPHHRPSGGDNVEAPWPGYLVGGGLHATGWSDTQSDFRTNEVAINWNAGLVYLLALCDQLPSEEGPRGAPFAQIRRQ